VIAIGAPPSPRRPPAPAAARVLGWISLGMGLTLLAPDRPARRFGLGRAARLMAVIGVRDVVIGLGLLRGRRPAVWLHAQAAADAVDATIVGLALLGVGGHRGGPGHPGWRVDRGRHLAWLGLAVGSAVVALRSARR
jgi:hypothetical protein